MRRMSYLSLATVLSVTVFFSPRSAFPAQNIPLDVGTTVNGFQDDFESATLSPGWVVTGQNAYSIGGGLLHLTTVAGDPNHLIYQVAGYDSSVQEVLARIRVTSFGSGDGSRGGIATAVDPATSQGINLSFRDEPTLGQRHTEFLDDTRAWGTEFAINWQNNTWYWLRLRHEPNAASQGGVNDVFGKIWLADGSQPEPAAWQSVYDYTPTRSARTGYAGIMATSSSGLGEFDVDYVLIKAAGLPLIVVAPAAIVQTPVTITSQPASPSVVEGASATFTVGYLGSPAPTFQWYRDGLPVGGATGPTYTLTATQLGDDGAKFKVIAQNVVSNITYTATSAEATLSVQADLTPPALFAVRALGLSQVQVLFSEPVTALTATNRSNYQITNAASTVTVTGITLDPSRTNALLNVSALTQGATYTLVVNSVRDVANAGNIIATNTHADFVAQSYTTAAIGNPQPAGGAVPVPGGLDVTAGGSNIGGTSDQFQFQYQSRTGDFDMKVRLDALSLADAWSEAGLIAREDASVSARFAGAVATPSLVGSYFVSRDPAGTAAAAMGSFPVGYPNTWLRLKRVGNQFTGFAGFDGQNWTALGSATIALPATLLVGFGAASHNTNKITTASFRDFSDVTSAGFNAGPLPVEPLGQSSRRTSLVISEIMYHPGERDDGKHLEYVELFNADNTSQDISGWRLDVDADFVFPTNTVIPSGGFLVVAAAPADVQSAYGITGVLGPFSSTNSLPNTKGTVQLRHRTGAVFLEAKYGSEPPWPAAADGAGHSLVLARPSYGEGRVEAWAASDAIGGSPGRPDPVTIDPLRNVVINEFLASSGTNSLDFIELYNHSAQPLDISGCGLSDSRNTNKFVIPPNTVLPPRGFVSYDETQLDFALSSGGETIYLRNPDRTRVLDAVRFGPQAPGVATGRTPDGSPMFSELVSPTPGTNNSAMWIRDVVINEIMYNPVSGDSKDEYIELFNRGTQPVSLAGWGLSGGISFTIPANTYLAPGGYLVLAHSANHLIPRYANLNAINTLGDYSGTLGNGGDRVALTMPVPFLATNNNVVTTNAHHVVVDEVNYRNGGQWGRWSDGGGSSLELIDPRSDNRLAANWADSEESAKAPWTDVVVKGVLDNGSTTSADELQALLLGRGECLIDNVQVLTVTGSNLIANSTFESGAAGWTAEGTQEPSGWESAEGAAGSAHSYRIRATDRGDNQVNRIRTLLSPPPGLSTTNTIRASVRWLKGHPEMLFRMRGNWLEAPVTMNLPTNLGTPGAANSRLVPNAPPAISAVTHYPPVPGSNEPVLVTARVHDPDGVGSVLLRYRLDPSATLSAIAMRDDGTGGDAVAGDGLYTATLPGQPLNTLVAFRIQAMDGALAPATAVYPDDAPTRECLVRFGETVPSGTFPSYRMWMTQASFNTWDVRNNLNNTLNDVTFVLGNHRVVYTVGAGYAGSPYIAPGFSTPSGNRCGYGMEFPGDTTILGDTAMVLDWPGGHGNENTAIQEEMAYWLADQMNLPFSHRHFIRLTVNGVTDMQRGGVFESVLQPGGNYIEQWSPNNSQGDFYKIDRSFEFSDAPALIADPMPQLLVYTTPDLDNGGTKKKTERYRWAWNKRSFEKAHDYTRLFPLADALNVTNIDLYTSQTEALADVEEWMGIFAAEHIINNFDSWGHDIGKNMYMFKPADGRSQIYWFDLDWLMLVSPNGPGNYTALTGPLFSGNDPAVLRMYAHPPFRRAYYRAVQNAVNNAFVTAKYEAVMDAKYNALLANGITLCDGQTLVNPAAVKTWFSQRRSYLVAQLATNVTTFAITNNAGADFSSGTNLITLSGSAPIEVKGLLINGVNYPVRWTSVTNWSVRLVLAPGQNAVNVTAYDASGRPLTNLTDSINIQATGAVESPVGRVVINEIMYHAVTSGAEYVEIYNSSTTSAFDLSGWRLNGVGYTFPAGTILDPRGFLLVVANRDAFGAVYGGALPVIGEFTGSLDRGGETLSLVQPGPTADLDRVIDSVTYDDDPPWPASADGGGSSLQLIDPAQDNSRVANWSDGAGWRLYSFTGTPGANATNLLLLMTAAGDVFVDDFAIVNVSGNSPATNVMINGDFETGDLTGWRALGNHSNTVVTASVAHSGRYSMHLIATGQGSSISVVSSAFASLVTNELYTFSFYFLPSTNTAGLTWRVTIPFRSSTAINLRPVFSTPGAVNSVSVPLPPFPNVWLNELLPVNVTGLTDNFGQHDPWVELFNAGSNTVNLSGWYLTDNYSNLANWPFPAGSTIPSGQFLLVWLDGEPAQSTGGALHTTFQLQPAAGSIALVFPQSGNPAILDYINYALTSPDQSIGLYPDGQTGPRVPFFFATPGATNNNKAAPRPLFINEWMAANVNFLADPADGHFDDWFELYNPNDVAVDLTRYSVSDRLNDPTALWTIPAGYSIAAHGFLLVWADQDTGQNSPDNPDLHAGFKLSQSGEAIGLFAPDGTLIDGVNFPLQTNNVSQGRWPDGGPNLYFMTTPTPRARNLLPGAPPELRIVNVSLTLAGQVILTWSTEPGKTYLLQTKSDLDPHIAWTDVGTGVLAASSLTSGTNAMAGAAQRFYRVQRVGP